MKTRKGVYKKMCKANSIATVGTFTMDRQGQRLDTRGLDLQMFADSKPDKPESDNSDSKNNTSTTTITKQPGEVTTTPEPENVIMSKAEFEAELQRVADQRVTQALHNREKKYKEELAEKTAAARKDAEELAKLSAEERAKVERERDQMQIKVEQEKLAAERRDFERDKLRLEAAKQLGERGIPETFAGYILGDDAEATMQNLTKFDKEWRAALDTAVDQRLRRSPPPGGNSGIGSNSGGKPRFTREQVEAMSQQEVNANLTAIEESMMHWK